MQTIIIHHSADFDGIFCREIARRALGDNATYIGWDYGDPVPEVPDDAVLYMLDISIEPLMSHPRLIWIDHHKSAIEKHGPGGPKFSWKDGRHAFCLDGVAACRLAWQWFFHHERVKSLTVDSFRNREVDETLAVRLAGEYDVWDKRDPRAETFQFGLRSEEEVCWWMLFSSTTVCESYIERLLRDGALLQRVRERDNASLITKNGFTIHWEGLTWLACNATRFNSLLFTAGLQPEHDACLGFNWDGRKWKVSLYGRPERPDLDLSLIAVRQGGGGHRQACGFECAELPFSLRG